MSTLKLAFAARQWPTAARRGRSLWVALRGLEASRAGRHWAGSVASRPVGTLSAPRPYVDPKLSYAYGRSTENLIYSTVARELERRLVEAPDQLAVVSHGERIKRTYRQLCADVDRLARTMVERLHIVKGDTVGVFAYNCYNWLLVEYACSRVGAVLTPINPSYKGDELAYVLEKGQVKCLFMPGPQSQQAELNDHLGVLQSGPVLELFRERRARAKLESVVLMDEENDYNLGELAFKLIPFGCQLIEWKALLVADGRVFPSAHAAELAGLKAEEACILAPDLVSPDDLFAVYYTSGTTGKSKGACCSQFTVINNVRLCQLRLRNGRPRNWHVVAATTLPLFHIFAGVLNALSPVVSSSQVVLASHKYDIRAYAESIIEHQANCTTLTPTMLIDLLTHVEQAGLRELPLRVLQPGGASMPPELVARAFKALPELEEIRSGYGSTENGAVATFQSLHEPEQARAYTVGPPLDFTEVRVVKSVSHHQVDAEHCSSASEPHEQQFEVVPLGERGEIQTRGHNTMLGYLNDPLKTSEVLLQNRWYRTGDIGFMHPHGSLEISGRLKHMIIKGGENIYPEEVEQMIHKLACVEKVHVVGVPDERFGEQVCAWLKLKPGYAQLEGERPPAGAPRDPHLVHRDDVLDFCKANITYFKVPKYLLFVDDFPMTPTKKVQNHVMVERSIELLKLKVPA